MIVRVLTASRLTFTSVETPLPLMASEPPHKYHALIAAPCSHVHPRLRSLPTRTRAAVAPSPCSAFALHSQPHPRLTPRQQLHLHPRPRQRPRPPPCRLQQRSTPSVSATVPDPSLRNTAAALARCDESARYFAPRLGHYHAHSTHVPTAHARERCPTTGEASRLSPRSGCEGLPSAAPSYGASGPNTNSSAALKILLWLVSTAVTHS